MDFIIPPPSDRKMGYLNISSTSYPFTIDDKVWRSVTHFYLAKRFEGTSLEEEIRKAKTCSLAIILSKPRHVIIEEDGVVKREIRYGIDKSCLIRDGWYVQDAESIREAVIAKFNQNPKIKNRLISTQGLNLIDESSNVYTFIINEIRSEFLNKEPPKKNYEWSIDEDFKSDILTASEIKIIKCVNYVSKKIARWEDASNEHLAEIIEDALCNVLGDMESVDVSLDIISKAKTWISNTSWTFIVKNMPNFEKIVLRIGKLLLSEFQTSLLVTVLIKWNRDNKVKLLLISRDIPSGNPERSIFIPPVLRKYRKTLPTNIYVTKKKESIGDKMDRAATYIDMFSKYISGENYSKLIKILEDPKFERDDFLEKFKTYTDEEKKNEIEKVLSM